MVLQVNINTPPPYLALNKNEQLPVVMTIAGSDSSGGAGIEADIKTITAHKCYAMTCVTALTAQDPSKVYSIYPIPKEFISQVLDANLKNMRCNVIKTGMLTEDAVEILHGKLIEMGSKRPKLVIDPVLVATSGSPLSNEALVNLSKKKITPLADLLTPNIHECFELIGSKFELRDVSDLYKLAIKVSDVTESTNVLVKGGHIPWNHANKSTVTDVLYLGKEKEFVVYNSPLIKTTATHGTGCTLASAIASNLSRGYPLTQSVYGGIEYVQGGVTISCVVASPHIKNNGPINHVFAIEIPLETMVQDECFTAHNLIPRKISPRISSLVTGDFFEYLISHPKVKPHWENYIRHEFVRQVVQGELPRQKFQFFIEQDYAYLLDYARVHCIAGSKAPSLDDMEKELIIVTGIRNELERHEGMLKTEFGITDNTYFDHIRRSDALKAYSRYFNDVAKRGNWEELVSSLSPCLMGYGNALLYFRDQLTVEKTSIYRKWSDTYLSTWYQHSMQDGRILLNKLACSYPADRLDNLLSIYANVCKLEINFWDSALYYDAT